MEFENLNIIESRIPKRCRHLVREWAELHQKDLIEVWDTQQFRRIEPLEWQ
jgi:hypothetical protein